MVHRVLVTNKRVAEEQENAAKRQCIDRSDELLMEEHDNVAVHNQDDQAETEDQYHGLFSDDDDDDDKEVEQDEIVGNAEKVVAQNEEKDEQVASVIQAEVTEPAVEQPPQAENKTQEETERLGNMLHQLILNIGGTNLWT